MTKICFTCKKEKSLKSFNKDPFKKDGHCSSCKLCSSKYQKENRRKYMLSTPHRRRASTTITHHKRQGYTTKITLDEMAKLFDDSKTCPICGVEYTLNGDRQTSPSLDRLNNEMELRTDNVWIICYKCNVMKQDKTMREFVDYCRGVVNKFGASHDVNE